MPLQAPFSERVRTVRLVSTLPKEGIHGGCLGWFQEVYCYAPAKAKVTYGSPKTMALGHCRLRPCPKQAI